MNIVFFMLSLILIFSGINAVRIGRNISCIKSQQTKRCKHKVKSKSYMTAGFFAIAMSLVIAGRIVS